MTKKKITNCGDCAYAQKDNEKMWCQFYDRAVNTKLVCDDFLDQYDSPQWQSLISGMAEEEKESRKIPQYTFFDILAYMLTALLFAAGIFVYCVEL